MKEHKSIPLVFKVFVLLAVLAIGIVLGIRQIEPPSPPSENSDNFAAYRSMMANIQILTTKPHPSGSAEIETVRAAIVADIENMELEYSIQHIEYTASEIADSYALLLGSTKEELWEQNSAWRKGGYIDMDDWIAHSWWPYYLKSDTFPLQNILVKLDAPGTDRGIMLVSHYDSVQKAPGAADAMVAVCAMLEAMRAYARDDALKNDIYFLLTDGEELGLLGAQAFVNAHPELKDKIDMVINLEARGNRGGAILFETSPGAYPLISAVMRSDATPIGFSWAAAIYSMMPNNTDLTVFLRNGYKGVNFAAIEGVENYHQPTDNYENLNKATASHYLQTALALTGYAAGNSLDELRMPPSEAVYFPFLPGVMVFMSGLMSHVLCVVACLLFLVFLAIQIIQNKNNRRVISFNTVLTGLLFLFSIGSAIWFAAGSYLFYIPLMCVTVAALFKKWAIANLVARALCGVAILLLWAPVVYALWVSMIQPMML